MTLLGTIGSASTGASKTIASVARSAYDGAKQSVNNTGRMLMGTPRSMLEGLTNVLSPEGLLTAAVGDNTLGQNIVKKIFDSKAPEYEPRDPHNESPMSFPPSYDDPQLLTGEVLDKLTRIDDDIVDLKSVMVGSGKSIEKTVHDTTTTQTIILSKGEGYNIINDVVKTIFNPIGIPDQNRIVPELPQLLEHKSMTTTAINHNNVADVLNREDEREDEQVAKQQADDIHAIREYIEKQPKATPDKQENSIIGKMADKLLGSKGDIRGKLGRKARGITTPANSMASRAGATIRALPATLNKGISNIGAAAKPVLSSAASMGKGALSAMGGMGAGTLAAGASALLFGGTGLYSAYKAAKGEESNSWVSNLIDNGIQNITGDKNTTLGSKLYDITNDDENVSNNITKTTINPTNDNENVSNNITKTTINPTIQPAKDKIISELVSRHENNSTKTIFPSSTITTSISDKSSFIKEPEPMPDAKQLEVNKIETEKANSTQAPIVINNTQAAPQKQQMTPGHGGGQSMAPMITRLTDSSLKRITDKMIGGSL